MYSFRHFEQHKAERRQTSISPKFCHPRRNNLDRTKRYTGKMEKIWIFDFRIDSILNVKHRKADSRSHVNCGFNLLHSDELHLLPQNTL